MKDEIMDFEVKTESDETAGFSEDADGKSYETAEFPEDADEKSDETAEMPEMPKTNKKIRKFSAEQIKTVLLCCTLALCLLNTGFLIKIYVDNKEMASEQKIVVMADGTRGSYAGTAYVVEASDLNEEALREYNNAEGVTTSTTKTNVIQPTTIVYGITQKTTSSPVTKKETETVKTTAAPTSPASVVVNINTASFEELTALNGIGEAKANAIIQYRNENGNFSSIEDITNVSGIGEKTYEKNKSIMTVG